MTSWKKYNPIDFVGRKFGFLTVVRPAEHKKWHKNSVVCLCVCGEEKNFPISQLLLGRGKSCGCRTYTHREIVPGKAGLSKIYARYKTNAKRAGIPFELSKEEVSQIIDVSCTYCGQRHVQRMGYYPCETKSPRTTKLSERFYVGMDQVVAGRGYTKDNVVPCCIRCNRAKHIMSVTDFLGHIKLIAAHQGMLEDGNESKKVSANSAKVCVDGSNGHCCGDQCAVGSCATGNRSKDS